MLLTTKEECVVSVPAGCTALVQWWDYVAGANWKHPSRPHSALKEKASADAEAYAKWAGKRLPSEAEWEFAAHGALAGKPFVWGDSFRPNG